MPCAVFCGDAVHAFDKPFPRRCQISFSTSGLLSLRSAPVRQFDFCRRALYGTAKLQASFLLTLHAAGGNHSVFRCFDLRGFPLGTRHQRTCRRLIHLIPAHDSHRRNHRKCGHPLDFSKFRREGERSARRRTDRNVGP